MATKRQIEDALIARIRERATKVPLRGETQEARQASHQTLQDVLQILNGREFTAG